MTKKFLAILFLGVSKHIETVTVIESFFDPFPVFGSGQSKKNWSKKFRAHPVSLTLEEF